MHELPAIVVSGLSVAYGDTEVVHGVDFSIGWGEICGYLGPNGAGKSTTLRAMVGVQPVRFGEIRISGCCPFTEAVAARQQFGFVPDTGGLFSLLTPSEHLAFVADLHELPREVAASRIEQAVGRFGISDFLNRRVDSLSTGQRQRVALACGLLHEPRVWILDEPMSGLDIDGVMTLRSLLREHADRGGTVLYSSHLLDVVERLCDRTLILAAGRVVADAPVADLLSLASDRRLETICHELTRPELGTDRSPSF